MEQHELESEESMCRKNIDDELESEERMCSESIDDELESEESICNERIDEKETSHSCVNDPEKVITYYSVAMKEEGSDEGAF